MRKALFAISLLFAVSSFAQDSPFRLSVFATNIGYTESDSAGSNFHGGIGAALEYRWNQRWALELSVASEEHTMTIGRIEPTGFTFERHDVRSYPIDLLAHYRFVNSTRWQPFVGAGVRHIHSSDALFDDRTSLEVDGGVHLMLTPALSIRIDAKQSLLDDDGTFDGGLTTSIGLGWKF